MMLRSWLESKTRPPAPPPRAARLKFESLEAREVPALYYWNPVVGVDGDYSANTAKNWVVETDPGIYNTATEAPDADDDLIFNGTTFSFPFVPETNSHADCKIYAQIGNIADVPDEEGEPSTRYVGQFKSVTISGGYTGVVRFQNNVLLESFSMSTGAAIAQENENALDRFLTVTNTFDWSAGVLNSDPDAGTIRLLGATGSITPPEVGELQVNAVLRVEDGTVGINGGVVNFHDQGLHLFSNSKLSIDGIMKQVTLAKAWTVVQDQSILTITGKAEVGKNMDVLAGGKVVFESGAYLTLTGANLGVSLRIWEAGVDRPKGKFYVNETGAVECQNNVELSGLMSLQNGTFFTQNQKGATFTIDLGGRLETRLASAATRAKNNAVGISVTDMVVKGESSVIALAVDHPGQGFFYTALFIIGKLDFQEGTFVTHVNSKADRNQDAHLIFADQIKLGKDSRISVINVDNGPREEGQNSWAVFRTQAVANTIDLGIQVHAPFATDASMNKNIPQNYYVKESPYIA